MSRNVQSDIRAKANVSAGSLQRSMLGFIIWSSHINDEIMILRVMVIPIKMQCQIFITVTVWGIIILSGKGFYFLLHCVLSSIDNFLGSIFDHLQTVQSNAVFECNQNKMMSYKRIKEIKKWIRQQAKTFGFKHCTKNLLDPLQY